MRYSWLMFLVLVLLIIPPTGAQEEDEAASAMPIIIDTDMALDDWLAILFLLNRPEVEVLAITVTGAGEAHCEPGVQHALELLQLAEQAEIPVACGRETPLVGNHTFPDWLRDNVDDLAGLELSSNPNPPFDGTAIELLTEIISDATEPVTLITLGPLTNIAELFEGDPSLIDDIEMITIMGGAVDVPGNVGFMVFGNSVAEANVYVDPHAAELVLASGAPITLVSLDATNHAPVTMDFYERLEEDKTTPEAEFVYEALTQQVDFIDSGGYFFWDPLAAAAMVDESLVTLEERSLIVIEEEGSQSGRTLEDTAGNPVQVAIDADGELFEELFLDTLNKRLEEE